MTHSCKILFVYNDRLVHTYCITEEPRLTTVVMILLTVFAALAAVLSSILYIVYKKRYQYWEKRGFLFAKPSIPWGNLGGAATKKAIGEIIHDIYKAFPEERFVGLWMILRPAVLIRDPEIVKSVFVRDFMTFHDRGIYVNEKDDPLSAHLFSIGGSKWRNMRVKLTPTFTSGKMKMMFPIMVQCSKDFAEILREPAEKEQVVEMKDYAARFTTDVISLAAFGLETDALHHPNAEFRKYGQKIFELGPLEVMKNMIQAMQPNIAAFLRLTTNKKEVSDFFLKAFKESMEYRENNKIRRNDFFDLLIQLKNKGYLDDVDNDGKEGEKFSFEEAAAQAFVFFVAGFETSSTTVQFALYELAKNPDIQEKAREEVIEILEKHKGEITYESVSEMEYLGRVIDETLRLHPPVPFLQREANKDYKVPDSDLTIPKGTTVLIDCYGLHQDALHFPEPDKFDPERFTEEAKSGRHHYAYLPFGEGPRNCIGSRFGLMQTRVGMMILLKNYRFTVAKETPIPLVLDPTQFITSPKGGMPLRISKI